MTGYVALGRMLPPWELFYNLWAEWFWSFTKLSISSTLVPCIGMRPLRPSTSGARTVAAFFGPVALARAGGALLLHAVRRDELVPRQLALHPVPLAGGARARARAPPAAGARACSASCALLVHAPGWASTTCGSTGSATQFTAGIGAVPEGARSSCRSSSAARASSDNTRSLLHAWGFYVTREADERAAPLRALADLPGHVPRAAAGALQPPRARELRAVDDRLADWMCNSLRSGGVVINDCDGEWRERWADFWRDAEPQFDHVLMWQAPADVMALVPARLPRRVPARRARSILERRCSSTARAAARRRCAARAARGGQREERRPHLAGEAAAAQGEDVAVQAVVHVVAADAGDDAELRDRAARREGAGAEQREGALDAAAQGGGGRARDGACLRGDRRRRARASRPPCPRAPEGHGAPDGSALAACGNARVKVVAEVGREADADGAEEGGVARRRALRASPRPWPVGAERGSPGPGRAGSRRAGLERRGGRALGGRSPACSAASRRARPRGLDLERLARRARRRSPGRRRAAA